MPQPVERLGRPASPGFAAGPVVHFAGFKQSCYQRAASAIEERQRFQTALHEAMAEVGTLLDQAASDGQAILEFQLAILDDTGLKEQVADAIASGASAPDAWSRALNEQIDDYVKSPDDYFRARSSDLIDLRDRLLGILSGEAQIELPSGCVLIGEDLSPSRFLAVDWSQGGGIALQHGSPLSHVAILARARGVPMVTGLGMLLPDGHVEAILDGSSGILVLSPDSRARRSMMDAAATRRDEERRAADFLAHPAITRDGSSVKVLVNIADPAEVRAIDVAHCDGIGLMRTEFLFRDGQTLPDEEQQYRAYRQLLAWAGSKPVTVRTLDAGGDKPITGLTPDGEANSFLGLRGLRLMLQRPEIFRVQLRALARAAVHGNLKVMWPMVTVPDELIRARALFEAELQALRQRGIACARPPLGMMIEVPFPALMPELFHEAEFFSIGSNDLGQYIAAAARDNAAVTTLADAAYPALLKLIAGLADHAAQRGVELSICGDLAGDPLRVPDLVVSGLRALSVAPPSLARVKEAVSLSTAGAHR